MLSKLQIEEIYDTYRDIEAYRYLEGQPFNFGDGLIINESKVSEDVYHKMELYRLKDLLSYNNNDLKQHRKTRLNRYERKKITQKRLKKVADLYGYFIRFDEKKQIYTRRYISGVRGYAKWCSRRKIRNRYDFATYKSNSYRRLFDYWYTIF